MLHYKFHQSTVPTDKLLVMLHGFISDQQTFDQHIHSLNKNINILTIDLPGHGADQSDLEHKWDFPFISHELDQTLRLFTNYQIYLHGYSMGGRIGLYYALYGQAQLTGLILESTSPGIENSDERQERQLVDQARAKVLEIAGLEVFVNDWEKLPFFYTQYELDKSTRNAIRDMRLRQNPMRLAKALRDYGTGQMPNLWPQLNQIQIPTCIIVGELDGKFCKIAKNIVSVMPNFEMHVVANSGHTIHVEEMAEFDRIVIGFINKEEQND
ncbi:2-succinyl-6-hydroxy-2,4-cyclohexadiene-1-carboxylate synthase [Staphylococcus saprophyticus]|uniref:2-succinyl-6-hydroxy-2, 4-cyclohexadiene-1-carboxylate synthase n=1 Tax=Staphylococcus saprophyticus TaxID=29385 RepID=UPI00158473B9|nr:2-succinyl-6-hydroxy-2,4-cyclohexadiene-1-carboxylate synthase [Staphylococcus saprophyticus]QKV11871.1 2-succinyl-6-hydroxy-2,4-cyclohexadiene-1-carboxylate synthase [Staphylococcus saprophyticus]